MAPPQRVRIRCPVAGSPATGQTAFCINCERGREKHPVGRARRGAGNRNRVFDPEAPEECQRILAAAGTDPVALPAG